MPRWRSCGAVSPTSTEMKDDFPVPLRPTRPTFSPAPTTKEASASRVRSPISMVRADPTITAHCTSENTCSIHSANARTRPQVVDPDRRLHGDLHAPPRHHGRERGAARHPAVAALELLRPAVGRRRLLADAGRLPPHRRRAGRHLRPPGGLRHRAGRLLARLAAVRSLDHAAHAQPGPRRPGRRRRHHVRHVARPHRRRVRGQGPRDRLRHLRRGDRRRRCHRPADRRRHHERHRLALDLLRQRPHRGRRRHHHHDQDRRVQGPAGSAASTGSASSPSRSACSLLVFALVRGNDLGWGSTTIVGLLVASAVLMVAFFVNELHTSDPMLDLGLFKIPAFVGPLRGGLHAWRPPSSPCSCT